MTGLKNLIKYIDEFASTVDDGEETLVAMCKHKMLLTAFKHARDISVLVSTIDPHLENLVKELDRPIDLLEEALKKLTEELHGQIYKLVNEAKEK